MPAGADGRVRHASAATISATPATTLPKISKVAIASAVEQAN
jgi:hypothetical protein